MEHPTRKRGEFVGYGSDRANEGEHHFPTRHERPNSFERLLGTGEELGLRCVFVSATLDRGTVAALGALDPAGFVPKPVQPAMLRRVIEQAAAVGRS